MTIQLVESLPTPIALVARRLLLAEQHDPGGRMVYEDALHLFEAFSKYTAIVLLSTLETLDRHNAQLIGYRLANSSAIGDWVNAISTLADRLTHHSTPDWVFRTTNWIRTKHAKAKHREWFEELVGRLKAISEIHRAAKPPDAPINLPECLQQFVWFRNKWAHGAHHTYFYEQAADSLAAAVVLLLQHAPVLAGLLISRYGAQDTRRVLLLVGPSPTRILQKDGTDYPNTTGIWDLAIVSPGWDDSPILLSTLLTYATDSQACTFANGPPTGRDAYHEFINYADGSTTMRRIPEYELPPHDEPPSLLGVAGFPELEPTVLEQTWPAFGTQVLRPRLVQHLLTQHEKLTWVEVDFTSHDAIRIPHKPGVYALTSPCHTLGLTAHSVVGYVGRTDDLRNRYNQYLEEVQCATGRPLIKAFVQEFVNVKFTYAVINDKEDRRNLEDWLIKAIDPPANKTGRIAAQFAAPESIWEE